MMTAVTADSEATGHAGPTGHAHAHAEHARHAQELLREGSTMAVYVAICLVAGIVAVPDYQALHPYLILAIWGFKAPSSRPSPITPYAAAAARIPAPVAMRRSPWRWR